MRTKKHREPKPNRSTTGQPSPPESVKTVSTAEINYPYPNRPSQTEAPKRDSSYRRPN
jgi:hypothetical protein